MYPVAKRIMCLETKTFSYLTHAEAKQYYHVGKTLNQGNVACAVFKKKGDASKTYVQPWAWLSFLRRPGAENISAKLDDAKALDIFNRSNNPKGDQDSVQALATEHGVATCTIRDIQKMRSWRHVTVPSLKPKAAAVIAAKNVAKKGTKISEGIAKFIVRDNVLHKIPVKVLATKYNLSKRSIQRIVSGKAWKTVTPAVLKEVGKWAP